MPINMDERSKSSCPHQNEDHVSVCRAYLQANLANFTFDDCERMTPNGWATGELGVSQVARRPRQRPEPPVDLLGLVTVPPGPSKLRHNAELL